MTQGKFVAPSSEAKLEALTLGNQLAEEILASARFYTHNCNAELVETLIDRFKQLIQEFK